MARARGRLKCSKVVRDEVWDTQNRSRDVAVVGSHRGASAIQAHPRRCMAWHSGGFVTKEVQMLRKIGILAGIFLLSCGGDDGFNPTTETVAGTYQLTTLKETQNGITLDHLALGVTAGVLLGADGTPPRHPFAPPGGGDGREP